MATAITSVPVTFVHQQLRFPGFVQTFLLAGAAKTVTKPSWARWAWVKTTEVIFANMNGVATDITGDTGAGGQPADGEGSFPIFPQDGYAAVFAVGHVPLAFSIFGTGRVAVCWYGDEGR